MKDIVDPIRSGRYRAVAFAVSLFATFIYFFPALRGLGLNAGHTLDHDLYFAWVPGMRVAHKFLASGQFQAMDWSVANGSTPFFLRPNFPNYHPLAFLVSAVVNLSSVQRISFAVTLIQAIHGFLSCYFSFRLCTRYLRMDGYVAAFVAVGYTFSTQMTRGMLIFPYSMIAMTVPMAVYLALDAAILPSMRRTVLASVPVVSILLAGYVPLAMTAIGLAAIGIAVWFLVLQDCVETRKEKLTLTFRGWIPLVLGSFVVFPYYVAIWLNLRAVLRLVSDFLVYPGPWTEFTLHWGVIGLAIVILYVVSFDPSASQEAFRKKLFLGCLIAYVFFMLIIYGEDSVFSAMMFYFVPLIGHMHVYQRYLLFAQFFLAIIFQLMLENAAAKTGRSAAKTLFFVSTLVLVIVAHIAFFGNQPWKDPDINEHFVLECLLTTIFLFVVVSFDRRVALLTATVFMGALATDPFWEASRPDHTYVKMSAKHIAMQPALLSSAADFMVRNSGKRLTKYHNVSPFFFGFVDQNVPWFVDRDVKLSNYQSYDMHVSTPRPYVLKMHSTVTSRYISSLDRPDWEWMRQTGADFIIFDPANPDNDPRIREFVDMSDPEQVFTLPDQSVIARLRFPPLNGPRVVADNGYVRLRAGAPAGIRSFSTDDGTYMRAVVESNRPSLLEYEFWPHRDIRVEVNGQRVQFKRNSAGLPYVDLPAGRSDVAILYRNWWVTAFGATYLAYALLIFALAAPPAYRFLRAPDLSFHQRFDRL
jgi:hypothetical protein